MMRHSIVLLIFALVACGGKSAVDSTGKTYSAYSTAGGPICGDNSGAVYCKPGDRCTALASDTVAATCATSTDGTYDPYNSAGGVTCGDGPFGGSVSCQTMGTCVTPGDAYKTIGACK